MKNSLLMETDLGCGWEQVAVVELFLRLYTARNARTARSSFVIGGLVSGRHRVVDRVPATLLAALADLVKWMDVTKMPSMVIGGTDQIGALIDRRVR
jgi:hypothetical protein